MKGDLFKGIVQYELQDGHGYKGKLPVFYPDASSIAAVRFGYRFSAFPASDRCANRWSVPATACEWRRWSISPG